MREKIKRLNKIFKTYPKKHHIEYVSALLSIPVILSVLILNFSNIESKSKAESISPTPTVQNQKQDPIIIQTSPSQASVAAAQIECKKDVGPISIEFPKENEAVSDNPICIIIKKNDSYCSSVWSYKINSGNWSQYDSNSPCLYNLPEGNIKFSLRVQSTVSSDTATIERNFIYQANGATPTASSSASQ